MATKLLTLVHVQKGDQVLLGLKKRGFGQGKWNGFGGKVHEGETVLEAMARELQEEAGLQADSFSLRGVMNYHYANGDIHEVHVGIANGVTATPQESEEMKPQWFSIEALPFDQMWPDDKIWLRGMLAGQSVQGHFYFDEQYQLINYQYEAIATPA